MSHDLTMNGVLPAEVLAELAGIVLAEETLGSLLAKVAGLTKQVIAGADEVSLTRVRRGTVETAASTGEMAVQADQRQYRLGAGPCLDATYGGEILHVPDMRTENRWPEYAPHAISAGVLSSLSVPLPIPGSLVAVNSYSRSAGAFDDRGIGVGKAFAVYAAIVLRNAETLATTAKTADHLRTALASRATIEQAKGLLMAHSGLSPDEAFALLVRASQRENRKLRDIAAELVARTRERASSR